MDWKHLLWIVPLIFLFAFYSGGAVVWNQVAHQCNTKIEVYQNHLETDDALLNQSLDMWQTYEDNCPEVYYKIKRGEIKIIHELT